MIEVPLLLFSGFQGRDPHAEDEGEVPQHRGLHESQLPFWRGEAKILKINWVKVSLPKKKINVAMSVTVFQRLKDQVRNS